MATVAIAFTHFDRSFAKGDEVPDDDPLVAGASHLFVQPDPEPEPAHRERRIRPPQPETPKSRKR